MAVRRRVLNRGWLRVLNYDDGWPLIEYANSKEFQRAASCLGVTGLCYSWILPAGLNTITRIVS